MVPNNTTLQDWLKAHRALMEAEQQFGALATDFSEGRVTQRELEAARESLLALRALCDAVFQRAVANIGNNP